MKLKPVLILKFINFFLSIQLFFIQYEQTLFVFLVYKTLFFDNEESLYKTLFFVNFLSAKLTIFLLCYIEAVLENI